MHVSAPAHADHDLLLIAGHAAGDLPDTQAASAATLLSSCSACSELHRDLTAIAAATRVLPRARRAPRDYRLTAEQAAGLRRGSWLRNLLRPLAAAGSASRPLAAAFTSVGVAGLLVAAFVPGLLGTAASGPDREMTGAGAGAPAPSAAPAYGPADQSSGAPVTAATHDPDVKVDAGDSGMEVAAGGNGSGGGEQGAGSGEDDRLGAITSPANLLVVGSLGLLLVGLAIFGLRLAARRLR